MDLEKIYHEAQECTYNDSPTFNIKRAVELFSAVISINPDFKLALEERSRCYFRLDMHAERIQDILAYTKQNPDVRSKVDIADSLCYLQRYSEAVNLLKGLDLNPQQMSTFGLRLREKLYRLTGQFDLAEQDKKQADHYDEEQKKLWDDPNYYGHYM
ncbi:MAG: hypothetical protein IPM74_08740 [Crocinitomicaceae bacterium]|nr:hypothetical protein [Crocinitomicaceae bacterium]MBK8925976.1 hypothetical protein [Crocinitomicaceae bacterium]